MKCSETCLTCSSFDICTTCLEPRALSKFDCLYDCP